VQATDGGVPIEAGIGVVVFHHLLETLHVLRQAIDGNGGILDECDRLGIALHRKHQGQPCFANLPNGILGLGGNGGVEAVPEAAALQRLPNLLDTLNDLAPILAAVLDDQDALGVALHEAAQSRQGRMAARLFDDNAAKELHGAGTGGHDDAGRLHRIHQAVEVDEANSCGLGSGDDPYFGIENDPQSSFRPHHQVGHVESIALQQVVEIEATDVAHDLRKAILDLIPVTREDSRHRSVEAAFEPFELLLRLPTGRVDLTEHDLCAVKENAPSLENVIDGLAIDDRSSSRRVVAHHAADSGAVAGRRVGPELVTEMGHVLAQAVLNDSRLHSRPLLLGVDLENPVEVGRAVDDEGFVDGLPFETRATAARQQRQAVLGGELHGGLHVVRMLGDNSGQRRGPVDTGVGAIQRQRHRVGTHLAANATAELSCQIIGPRHGARSIATGMVSGRG